MRHGVGPCSKRPAKTTTTDKYTPWPIKRTDGIDWKELFASLILTFYHGLNIGQRLFGVTGWALHFA